MDIIANTHNLKSRIDYALANLREKMPDITARMSWHWTDVVMSNRLRRCVGMCRYRRLKDILTIEFSAPLFANIGEMEKTDTVIHELAHAIVFRLNLEKPGHGPIWRSIARAMGGTGERCATLPADIVKRNLVKRWVLTRLSDTTKLFIRTRKDACRLPYVYNDVVLLGVAQMDQNKKTVKWLHVRAPEMRNVNPLGKDWVLV